MLDAVASASSHAAAPAFNTADLLLLRGWAEFHGLSMGIDLARRIDDLQCDEVVLLAAPGGSGHWALWRDRLAVRLQPQTGPARSFASVYEAMEAVMPQPAETITDIQPTVW